MLAPDYRPDPSGMRAAMLQAKFCEFVEELEDYVDSLTMDCEKDHARDVWFHFDSFMRRLALVKDRMLKPRMHQYLEEHGKVPTGFEGGCLYLKKTTDESVRDLDALLDYVFVRGTHSARMAIADEFGEDQAERIVDGCTAEVRALLKRIVSRAKKGPFKAAELDEAIGGRSVFYEKTTRHDPATKGPVYEVAISTGQYGPSVKETTT